MDIQIIWKGESRMLPGIGYAEEGDTITCEYMVGKSFILQNLADALNTEDDEIIIPEINFGTKGEK